MRVSDSSNKFSPPQRIAPPTISPGGSGTNLIIDRAVILFPQPDSPTIPNVSPGASTNEISSKTRMTPSRVFSSTTRFSTSRTLAGLETPTDYRSLNFGLSASFRPSPIKPTLKIVKKIAAPGNNTDHQVSITYSRLLPIIKPQLIVLGSPSPR